jgi:hypothetical protein
MEVIDFIVSGCEEKSIPRKEWAWVIQCVLLAARRWKDVDPLLRVLRVCRVDSNIDRVSAEDLALAIQDFGWKPLATL